MAGRKPSKSMTAVQLCDALIDDLRQVRDEIQWKNSIAYGARNEGDATHVSGGSRPDPTASRQSDGLARHVRNVLSSTHRDLKWLWGKKIPDILARLELDDEIGGDQGSGVSAYRGDTTAPAGRPDVDDALDAQRRRIERGQSHGEG